MGEYLSDTISSVGKQTFENFEYIIVDDGSTDDSLHIAEHYALHDSRITVISQNNYGAAAARNAGIRKTRGKYLAFVDGDDVWHPALLKLLYNAIKDAPDECVGTFCWSIIVNKRGKPASARIEAPCGTYNLARMMRYVNPIGNGSALLLKKGALVKAGSFKVELASHLRHGDDAEMWLRMLSHEKNSFLQCVPKPLVYYRRRKNSYSDISKKSLAQFLVYLVSEFMHRCTVLEQAELYASMAGWALLCDEKKLASKWLSKSAEMNMSNFRKFQSA